MNLLRWIGYWAGYFKGQVAGKKDGIRLGQLTKEYGSLDKIPDPIIRRELTTVCAKEAILRKRFLEGVQVFNSMMEFTGVEIPEDFYQSVGPYSMFQEPDEVVRKIASYPTTYAGCIGYMLERGLLNEELFIDRLKKQGGEHIHYRQMSV